MLWQEEMEGEKEPCVGLFAMKQRQEFPGVLPQGKAVRKVAPSSTSIYDHAASEVSGQLSSSARLRISLLRSLPGVWQSQAATSPLNKRPIFLIFARL